VLLYEVLTGRIPYQAESVNMLLRKKAESRIRVLPPSYFNAWVTPSLDNLILSLIDFLPGNRPTISEFLLHLGRIAMREVDKKVEWREA